jgi:hypothetical protein
MNVVLTQHCEFLLEGGNQQLHEFFDRHLLSRASVSVDGYEPCY